MFLICLYLQKICGDVLYMYVLSASIRVSYCIPYLSPQCFILMYVVQSLSCVQLFATLWTMDRQAPLSMGFPRQEYWSRLPFPSPGDLLGPGIELVSPAMADGFFTNEIPAKPILNSH